jgi:hexosaminidase
MKHLHRRIRLGLVATLTGALAGALAVPVLSTMAPLPAQAAVLCTQTIVGAHSGVLNVAANQKLCLVGAVQDSAVNVAPGGALSVSLSTITGAITLKSGFTSFDFCASKTVRGAISATGAQGTVLIGGSGPGALLCPANTIDGAITLNANKAGVTLAFGTISGAVTASANLGGTTISGNHIGGNITCTTNVPAPTNAGVANSVGGGRAGQTSAVNTF